MNKTTTQKKNLTPEIELENPIPELAEVIQAKNTSQITESLFLTDDTIEKSLKKVESFGILSLRIDNKNKSHENSEKIIEKAEHLLTRQECLNEKREGYYFCYYLNADKKLTEVHAETLKKNLNHFGITDIYLGIATYPKLSFSRKDIRTNAVKANIHATYFDPGAHASFDDISLNISGDRYYQKGDIDKALSEYKKALEINPANTNVRNSLGVCYGVQSKFEEALKEFNWIIKKYPKEIMSIHNAGLIFLLMEKKKEALKMFKKAGCIKKDIFEVEYHTGKLYLEMAQAEKGLNYFEKAVSLNPQSPHAFRHLADCHMAMGDNKKALMAYKQAIKFQPDDALSLASLAEIYIDQNRNREIAIIFCKKSIEISPDNSLIRQKAGNVFRKAGLLKEAIEEYDHAQKLGFDSSEIINSLKENINLKG